MDIVERLRKFSAPTGGGAICPREMAKEAADVVERLREMGKQDCDMVMEAADEIERLREALSDLVGLQNGPPLVTWTEAWNAAMKKAHEALKEKE